MPYCGFLSKWMRRGSFGPVSAVLGGKGLTVVFRAVAEKDSAEVLMGGADVWYS